jgi:hypothetical protein
MRRYHWWCINVHPNAQLGLNRSIQRRALLWSEVLKFVSQQLIYLRDPNGWSLLDYCWLIIVMNIESRTPKGDFPQRPPWQPLLANNWERTMTILYHSVGVYSVRIRHCRTNDPALGSSYFLPPSTTVHVMDPAMRLKQQLLLCWTDPPNNATAAF